MRNKNILAIIVFIVIAIFFTCRVDDNNTERPEIVSVSPADHAGDVTLDAIVTLVFSENMDESTITEATFVVENGEGLVEGTVNGSGKTTSCKACCYIDFLRNYGSFRRQP